MKQITPIPQAEEVTIYLKQARMRIRINERWTALSDRLVQQLGLPRGSLLRIYPVDMNVQRLGNDDHAYFFDWIDEGQYWFDIVHDHDKDPHDFCREIRMVDSSGRVETLDIPGLAQIEEV